jgi:hypothetical protein
MPVPHQSIDEGGGEMKSWNAEYRHGELSDANLERSVRHANGKAAHDHHST